MSLTHDYGFLADANSNMSLPGVYHSGDYVTHPVHGDGVVDHEILRYDDPKKGTVFYTHNGTTHASGFTYMTVMDVYKDKRVTVPYEELTPMTLRRFFLWKNPYTGWSMGRHGIFAAGLRYGAFVAMSIYGATQLHNSLGWLAMVLAPIAIIGLMIRGLVRNYKGKQM